MEPDDEFVVPVLCGAQSDPENDERGCMREVGHQGSHVTGNDWTVWDD